LVQGTITADPFSDSCFTAKSALFASSRENAVTRTEWHRVYAWRNLSKFARTLQKGQLITMEGILRYREVEDEVKGTTFKHRIAEIHAISMKRLSKVETTDDPSDGADDE
jgi:single-strand DNA-binding protein